MNNGLPSTLMTLRRGRPGTRKEFWKKPFTGTYVSSTLRVRLAGFSPRRQRWFNWGA